MLTPTLTNPNTNIQVPLALSGGNSPSLTPNSNNSGLSLSGGGDPTATTGTNIFNTAQDAFNTSPQESTIMDTYNNSLKAAQGSAAATGTQIADQGNANISYQNEQSAAQGTAALEENRGFVVNPGQIKLLSDASTNAVRLLTQQRDDALAQNDSAAAAQYSALALQETTAMTNARTSFLNDYFNSQSEARSEATFPLSQQLTQAQIQEAQAAASSSTAGAALAKAQASQTAALTPAQIEATLAQAGASSAGANASNATAAQTNALTAFLKQGNVGSSDPNVQSLLNKTATPDQIQTKYPSSLYGGYAAAIISAAQAAGYNLNAGTLAGQSQASLTSALSSGNPFSLVGGLATEGMSAVGNLLNLNGNSSKSLTPSYPVGTDGTAYGYPGYVSNGTAWVKK